MLKHKPYIENGHWKLRGKTYSQMNKDDKNNFVGFINNAKKHYRNNTIRTNENANRIDDNEDKKTIYEIGLIYRNGDDIHCVEIIVNAFNDPEALQIAKKKYTRTGIKIFETEILKKNGTKYKNQH